VCPHERASTISREIKFESSLDSHARSSEARRDSRAGVLLQTNIFLLACPTKHEMSLTRRLAHTRLDPSKIVTSGTRHANVASAEHRAFTLLRGYYRAVSIIIRISRPITGRNQNRLARYSREGSHYIDNSLLTRAHCGANSRSRDTPLVIGVFSGFRCYPERCLSLKYLYARHG